MNPILFGARRLRREMEALVDIDPDQYGNDEHTYLAAIQRIDALQAMHDLCVWMWCNSIPDVDGYLRDCQLVAERYQAIFDDDDGPQANR